MKQRNAELLLAGVIVARATSLLFSKLSMRALDPFNLLGLRFTIAFGLLMLLFGRRFRGVKLRTVFHGFLLGASFFAVMTAELFGLRATDSSTTSFLENTAIVWVPLLAALLRRRAPGRRDLGCAGLTLLGVGFLTLKGGVPSFGQGELLCLAASLLYAGAILLTARLSREDDPLLLGILQLGFLGLLGFGASFLFEQPRLPAAPAEWGMVLMLALVCSGFGFTLQPVAQRYVSAEKAGLFCALNPLTAATLGVLFLGEPLTPAGLIGAGLIACGFVLRSLPPRQGKPALGKRIAQKPTAGA